MPAGDASSSPRFRRFGRGAGKGASGRRERENRREGRERSIVPAKLIEKEAARQGPVAWSQLDD